MVPKKDLNSQKVEKKVYHKKFIQHPPFISIFEKYPYCAKSEARKIILWEKMLDSQKLLIFLITWATEASNFLEKTFENWN